MRERTATVATADGSMETFIAHPEGRGAYPAVIMYQNVGGLSELLRGMARRLAAEGYYCAVPDLYYRYGKIVIDPDDSTPEVMAVRKAVVSGMRNGRVMEDTRALLAFLDQDPMVRAGPKGAIGYCMGGRYCLLAAQNFPDRIRATSSLFPTLLMTEAEDSPHRHLDRIAGEVYFGFAEHDHSLSLADAAKFTELLKAQCRAKWEAEVHPGTEHGFAFPGRKVYHRDASELAWQKSFAMFDRVLRG
jgi:carboxymethylenebutenolidase